LENKVIVTVKGKMVVDGEEDTIELITSGKFYKKGNAYYIVYKETELSGMEGTTTTVKIEEKNVCIIRFGSVMSRMCFKDGETELNLYKTPYGIFELTVKAFLVDIDINDDGGNLRLYYGLEAAGMQKSINELSIKIQISH
jgi:uncharacterized beta-barrel protein YwiB (DUF1934 family)